MAPVQALEPNIVLWGANPYDAPNARRIINSADAYFRIARDRSDFGAGRPLHHLSELQGHCPMLEAYIDDSASDIGDQRLLLAGYINRADRWSRFSGAWEEELRASPSIEYLKMSEANCLGRQFRGWSPADRDEKLRGLARVIRHFKPASIHCSVSRLDYANIVKPVAPYGLGNPYGICFHAIMVTLANSQLEHHGINVPIAFIFDQQEGLGEEARMFYEYIRETQPRPVRQLLSKTPRFGDDKVVLPLQAADMLAWHVRRHAERGDPDSFMVPDFLSADGYHMATDIDAHRLRSIANGFSQVQGVPLLKGRGAWKKTKREIIRLTALGVTPPYRLARLKNTLLYARKRLARIFRT
jgi:Protein of unknown function (DUF3800)